MVAIFQFVATLAAILFAGAAVYVSAVEHPARMECGTELAATVFGPSYRRGAVLQVILAITATIAGTATWYLTSSSVWLGGALLIFALIPYTLLVIMPTNKRLLDTRLDRNSETAHQLLRTWGTLHAVRSIVGLAASLIFLSALVWRK